MEQSKSTYFVSVDGSKHSDYAFDIGMNLRKSSDKIIVGHVFNKNKEVPFDYQSETLLSKYETKLLSKLTNEYYSLDFSPRSTESIHALQDIYTMSQKHSASMILVGFKGHKQIKGDSLTKGVSYIASNIKTPVLICKEPFERKEGQAVNWLFPIDKLYGKAQASFEFALQMIDKENDFVKGVNLHRYSRDEAIEGLFAKHCETAGIKNFKFEYVDREKDKGVGEQISDIVNFGEINFNFIVCGHNPFKYRQLKETPLTEIIRKAQTNILFKR